MPKRFDPYHSWLGIPPRQQPPNHYRLLGVQHYEDDVEVIANAADRQMAHVRTFQTGQHGEASQRILNEIAKAKVCLLNAAKKTAYDEQLRGEAQSRRHADSKSTGVLQAQPLSPPDRPNATAAAPQSQPQPNVPIVFAATEGVGRLGTRRRSTRGRSPRKSKLVVALLCALVPVAIIVTVVVSVKMTRQEPQNVADRNVAPVVESSTHSSDENDAAADAVGRTSQPHQAGENQPSEDDPDRVDVNAPSSGDPDEEPSKTDDAAPIKKSPDTTGSAEPSGIVPEAKFPVPEAAKAETARAEIRDLFGLDGQVTRREKYDAAKQLIEAADAEEPNSPAHFAALSLCRDLASECADASTAFKAIDAMNDVYQIDRWAMRLNVLQTVLKSLPDDSTRQRFVAALFKLRDEATAEDRYQIASDIARLALVAARPTKDKELIRAATRAASDAKQRQQHFDRQITPALATLDKNPDDAAAKLVIGSHYCLTKGDWRHGLPLLAGCDNPLIRQAALLDLQTPPEMVARTKVGDAWYAVGQSSDQTKRFHARAHYWYTLVLPDLSGLIKLKVTKRVNEISEFAANTGSPSSGEVTQGEIGAAIVLPDVKLVLQRTLLEEGDAGVKSLVAFSPTGSTLAVAYPRLVKLINTKTGKPRRGIDDRTIGQITAMAFAPNGEVLALGSAAGTVTLWNLNRGTKLGVVKVDLQSILALAFSPDGSMLVCTGEVKTLRVIDTANLKVRYSIRNDLNEFQSIAFSPDGKTLAIGRSRGTITLFDPITPRKIEAMETHSQKLLWLAFSPNGKLLASASEGNSIRLWNAKTGELIVKMAEHLGPVRGVAFASDSKWLATVSDDETIKLWDVRGKLLATLQGHPPHKLGRNSGSIAFSPNGRLLASCGNYTLKLWMVSDR